MPKPSQASAPRPASEPKILLRSRSKEDKARYRRISRAARKGTVKLAPTYKVLSKSDRDEQYVPQKTKNDRAKARIKRMVDQWGKE